MAIGLGDVFVLQAAASNLYQFRERILQRGFAYRGPALFSVFSGAGGEARDLPPYLAAAAAMESRAFPAFTYDPSAGANWAARFRSRTIRSPRPTGRCSASNTPTRTSSAWPKTSPSRLIDFVAADAATPAFRARAARAAWGAKLASVSDCLGRDRRACRSNCPRADGRPRTCSAPVIVDDKLMRAAQRCREPGTACRSSAASTTRMPSACSRAKQGVGGRAAEAADRAPAATPAAVAPAPAAGRAAAPAAEPRTGAFPGRALYRDRALLDLQRVHAASTTRCSPTTKTSRPTSRTWTRGTYRQLVEAAESCQVAIIHPGKPRNRTSPASTNCSRARNRSGDVGPRHARRPPSRRRTIVVATPLGRR